MNKETLLELLQAVAAGKTAVSEAAGQLQHLAYEDIDCARIDHHRSLRKGFPEVIFGQGKTADQVIGIIWVVSRRPLRLPPQWADETDTENANPHHTHFDLVQ